MSEVSTEIKTGFHISADLSVSMEKDPNIKKLLTYGNHKINLTLKNNTSNNAANGFDLSVSFPSAYSKIEMDVKKFKSSAHKAGA